MSVERQTRLISKSLDREELTDRFNSREVITGTFGISVTLLTAGLFAGLQIPRAESNGWAIALFGAYLGGIIISGALPMIVDRIAHSERR